jgi:hypothetical protein
MPMVCQCSPEAQTERKIVLHLTVFSVPIPVKPSEWQCKNGFHLISTDLLAIPFCFVLSGCSRSYNAIINLKFFKILNWWLLFVLPDHSDGHVVSTFFEDYSRLVDCLFSSHFIPTLLLFSLANGASYYNWRISQMLTFPVIFAVWAGAD